MTSSKPHSPALRIVLHAPTPDALARARASALNARKADAQCSVRIIANATAVAAALDQPHADADALTGLCPNTLAHSGRQAHAPLTVLERPAVIELALLQQAGWAYIHA
jgi:intracellular sulfur oxidation DsrE/DsrF family protein